MSRYVNNTPQSVDDIAATPKLKTYDFKSNLDSHPSFKSNFDSHPSFKSNFDSHPSFKRNFDSHPPFKSNFDSHPSFNRTSGINYPSSWGADPWSATGDDFKRLEILRSDQRERSKMKDTRITPLTVKPYGISSASLGRHEKPISFAPIKLPNVQNSSSGAADGPNSSSGTADGPNSSSGAADGQNSSSGAADGQNNFSGDKGKTWWFPNWFGKTTTNQTPDAEKGSENKNAKGETQPDGKKGSNGAEGETWFQTIQKKFGEIGTAMDKNPHWKENKDLYLTAAGTLGIAAAAFGVYKRIKAARRRSIRNRYRSSRYRSRYSSRSYVSAKDVLRAEQAFKRSKANAANEAKRLDALVKQWSSKTKRSRSRSRSLSRSSRSHSRSSSRSFVSTKDVQKAERAFKSSKANAENEAKRLKVLVNQLPSKNMRSKSRSRSSSRSF